MITAFLIWITVLLGFFAALGAVAGLLDRWFPAWDPGEAPRHESERVPPGRRHPDMVFIGSRPGKLRIRNCRIVTPVQPVAEEAGSQPTRAESSGPR